MSSKLHSIFKELETKKNCFQEKVSSVSSKKLAVKPAENKWSVIQIYFHVVKTEMVTTLAIENSLKHKDELQKSGLEEFVNSKMLSIAIKSPFKIKSPKIVANPPETYKRKELDNKWNSVREKLSKIIDEFPIELENKNTFKHPYTGYMNIFRTLKFLSIHIDNHLQQIERVLKTIEKQ